MSKLLANPKMFAATGVLFALATLFNYASSTLVEAPGTSMTLSPKPAVTADPNTPTLAAEPRKEVKAANL